MSQPKTVNQLVIRLDVMSLKHDETDIIGMMMCEAKSLTDKIASLKYELANTQKSLRQEKALASSIYASAMLEVETKNYLEIV